MQEPRLLRSGNGTPHMRYFITFVCYGAHFHGDEAGSVDRDHNQHGTRFADPSPVRIVVERQLMDQAPYRLDKSRRAAVLQAIHEVCEHRGWTLWAAHVRTNHVHLVVEADVRPEIAMNTVKSYASRSLNRLQLDQPCRKRWARHGSTRWLAKDDDVLEAIRYVVWGQGEPMEVYLGELT